MLDASIWGTLLLERTPDEPRRSGMISVVIPAYNEEHALPATLARVLSEAAAREIIVVDGGSTDATTKPQAVRAPGRLSRGAQAGRRAVL